jgi:hypothetical protein
MLVDGTKYGKEFGKSRTLEDAFKVFLTGGDGVIRNDVAKRLIERIDGLIKAMRDTDGLSLYSSSLLIVYEGTKGGDEIDVRLIDFAHSYWQGGLADDGVLFGLGNLKMILEGVHERE